MIKLDLKKDLKSLYSSPAGKPTLVDVPKFNFAQIDGVIEPGCRPGDSPWFKAAVSALYGISYTLKFMAKKRADNPVDYPVMGLEALWSTPEGTAYDFSLADGWQWTAMILQPEIVTPEMWIEAIGQLKKKRGDVPAIDHLRLEPFHEGLSIQILHIGPYDTEPESLAKMDAFAVEHGYSFHSQHHEIYLSDPLRTEPSKLKTLLRHPVKK